MRLGRSEEEIVGELGNPRLLAKTIIEAAKREGRSGYVDAEYEEVYEDGTQTQSHSADENTKPFRLPGWLILLLVMLVLFVIIRIIGSVVIAFLPIIIPATCAWMVIRFLQRR